MLSGGSSEFYGRPPLPLGGGGDLQEIVDVLLPSMAVYTTMQTLETNHGMGIFCVSGNYTLLYRVTVPFCVLLLVSVPFYVSLVHSVCKSLLYCYWRLRNRTWHASNHPL